MSNLPDFKFNFLDFPSSTEAEEKAQLSKEGDVIISLNKTTIASVDDVHRLLSRDTIGTKLEIVMLRDWTSKLEKSIEPVQSPD